MGGKIEVDSQVNKGSIFKVELLQKNFNNEDIIDKEIEYFTAQQGTVQQR